MNELQNLYDVLSRDGYYTKSFEEFQSQYQDPAYRDKVFDVVTRDGLYTKSREEFDVKYAADVSEPVKKKEDTVFPSEDGSSELSPLQEREQQERERQQDFSAQQRTEDAVKQAIAAESQPEEEVVGTGEIQQFFPPTGDGVVMFDEGVDISDPMAVAAREGRLGTARTGRDMRETGYVNPVQELQTIFSLSQQGAATDAQVQAAQAQLDLDRQYTLEAIEVERPATEEAARQERMTEEMTAVIDAEAQERLAESEELQTAFDQANDNVLAAESSDTIEFLTDKFGQFGIVFKQDNVSDALRSSVRGTPLVYFMDVLSDIEAIAPNGERMVVKTRLDGNLKKGQLQKLKTFIAQNGAESTALSKKEEDEINKAWRAQTLRDVGRLNEDGSESTVLMAAEIKDGKYYAFPTLFPTDPENYSLDPSTWTQYDDHDEAYKVAKERGELFEFEEWEDALAFGEGSWKDVNASDVAAHKFFKENYPNLDYAAFKTNYDTYNDSKDEMYFLQNAPLYIEELTIEEKSKYGDKYYINGTLREDSKDNIPALDRELSLRFDIINQDEYKRAQEDFDVEQNKIFEKKAIESSRANYVAKSYEKNLNDIALREFGVELSDISTIEPQDDMEEAFLEYLKEGMAESSRLSELAANKYQLASTWFDSKLDQKLRGDLIENWEGWKSNVASGWNRGQAAEEILKITLGLTDLDDEATTMEVAQAVVEYMEKANTGDVNRVMNRWHQAKGFLEAWQVFQDNPAELALTMAAESMSQMMPYGFEIVGISTGAGAAIGAGAGLIGGPAAPATVPMGAFAGGARGVQVGMAATALAMEYTNAVFDAMREKGYDLTDPQSVQRAFQDEEVWSEGAEIGLKRGIPIATVDFLSSGLAGRIFTGGRLANRGVKLAAQGGERLVFDPMAEAFGEISAQFVAGQELDWKEVAAESLGSIGNNAPMAVANQALDAMANSKVQIAQDLMTLQGMVKEKASDSHISSWANKMQELGQISEEQNQRIQENIGLRRDAKELLGGKASSNTALNERVMELLNAKEVLSATPNRKSVYSDKITQITQELTEIVSSKTLRDKDSQTPIPAVEGLGYGKADIREGVSRYKLKGKDVTRAQFLAALDKMSYKRFLKVKPKVENDDEVKLKLKERINAIQEQSAEGVDVQEQTTVSEEVGEGDVQQEFTEEVETQEESQPVLDIVDEVSETDITSFRDNTIEDSRQESLLAGIARKLNNEEELSAFQNEMLQGKEFEVANLQERIASEEAIEAEAQDLESMLDNTQDQAPQLMVEEDVEVEEAPIIETPQLMMSEDQQKIKKLAQAMGMENKGYFNPQTQVSQIRKNFARFGLGAERARTNEYGQGGGVYLTRNGKRYNPFDAAGFALDRTEAQKNLIEEATRLMEEVQPENVETVESVAPADVISITVTENSELANKVKSVGLDFLVGKKINLVMADQLKVSEDYMGGPFFPLMDGLYGKVAWASMNNTAAGGIINGAIDADYSVVFNMSPTAVYSNKAFRQEILKNLSPKSQKKLYSLIKKSKKFKTTKKSRAIINNSTNLKQMFDLMDSKEYKFSVEDKIKFFKNLVPTKDVKATEDIFVLMQNNNLNSEQIIENIQEEFTKDLPLGALTTILEVTTKDGKKISDVIAQIKKDVASGKINKREGNKRINAAREEAIISKAEQKKEGMPEHPNYPVYVRGKAVALLNETTSFWNVLPSYKETVEKKMAGIVTDRDSYTVDYDGQEARALVRENEDGSRSIEVKAGTKTLTEFSIPSNNNIDTETYINKNIGKVGKFKEGKRVSSKQAETAAYSSAQKGASRAETLVAPVQSAYQRFVSRLSKAFPNVEVVVDQQEFDALLNNLSSQQLVTKNQKVYGAVLGGKLYLNPDLKNYNTPVHEFGHIWMNTAKELAPESYQKGLQLVADTDYTTEVENNPAYKKIIKNMREQGVSEEDIRNYILEEALATAIGNKGESFATAAQKKNFKNWLNELFEFIKKLTGISELSSDQIQNLNLDEFLNAVVVDLMSENEVFQNAEIESLGNELQLMTFEGSTITEIVSFARAQNFSDAAIKAVLKRRRFDAEEINEAMQVFIDIDTPLPEEFGFVKEQQGSKLFNEVRQALDEFARGTRRTIRRAAETAAEKKARAAQLREQQPTLFEGQTDEQIIRDNPRPPQPQQVVVTRPTTAEVRAKAQELLLANPIYEAQTEQVQKELRVAMDRTLHTTANRTVQKEMSAIKNMLRERRVGVKNLKEAQLKLKNFIRQNLPKSTNYTQADINKLVYAMNNIKNLEGFYAEAERVMEVVEKQRRTQKQTILKKLKKLIKQKAKVKLTRSAKRRSAGLDAEGQALMNALAKVVNNLIGKNEAHKAKFLESEAKFMLDNQEKIDALYAKVMYDQGTLTPQEEKLINRQVAFDMLKDIDGMTLEEAQALLETVTDLRKEAVKRLISKRAARRMEYEEVRVAATEQIKKTNPELFDEEGNPLSGKELDDSRKERYKKYKEQGVGKAILGWTRRFFKESVGSLIRDTVRNKLMNIETLTNIMDRTNKGLDVFRDKIYVALNRMNENHLRDVRRTRLVMDDIAKMAGFKEGYFGVGKALSSGFFKENQIELNVINPETGRKRPSDFTLDELLRIYALSLNDDQRKKLAAQGITESVVEDIKVKLGPELVSFADGVVSYLSTVGYEEVNAVYSDVNDVNLGYIENYFPTKTIKAKVDSKVINDGDFNGIFSAETAPALKERVDTTQEVDLRGNFTSVLENHVDVMSRYKAYARGVKLLNALFETKAVDILVQELGIKGTIKQLINTTVNPNAAATSILKPTILTKLQQKYTGFALAFKMMQIPKQASSFINAMADYSYLPEDSNVPRLIQAPLDILMFMVDGATLIAQAGREIFTKEGPLSEAREMSATFDDRIRRGLMGDVYGLESGGLRVTGKSESFFTPDSKSKVARAGRKFKAVAGATTAVGDILGVSGYLINYRRNIKNGMDKQEAVEVFNDYNATQQSRRGTEKTPLQNTKSGLMRTFTMFGSVLFLQLNKALQASRNMRLGAAEGSKTIAEGVSEKSAKKIAQGFKQAMPTKKDSRSLFLNVTAANVMFTAMSNIFLLTKGDEEDREKALIRIGEAMVGLNILYAIPLIGSSVESMDIVGRMIQGDDYKENIFKRFATKDHVNPLDRIFSEATKALTKDKDTGKHELDGLIENTMELVIGTQVDPFVGLFNLLGGGSEEGIENDVYDLIGVSSSYRPKNEGSDSGSEKKGDEKKGSSKRGSKKKESKKR